jgi:hypothetical protein
MEGCDESDFDPGLLEEIEREIEGLNTKKLQMLNNAKNAKPEAEKPNPNRVRNSTKKNFMVEGEDARVREIMRKYQPIDNSESYGNRMVEELAGQSGIYDQTKNDQVEESDEAYARRLQEEFDRMDNGGDGVPRFAADFDQDFDSNFDQKFKTNFNQNFENSNSLDVRSITSKDSKKYGRGASKGSGKSDLSKAVLDLTGPVNKPKNTTKKASKKPSTKQKKSKNQESPWDGSQPIYNHSPDPKVDQPEENAFSAP